MTATRLEFRILGPLAVRMDGAPVPIGGPKQRALLALLLLNANRVVPRKELIEELFVGQSVNSADHALRNHVSRLRKVFGPVPSDAPRLIARAPGYLLRVEPGELDFERFESLVEEGREALAAGDAAGAAESLQAAETLWSGPPLADIDFETFTRVDVERLEELRLAAVEARIDAQLALGRQLGLVAELEALVVEHPFREHFRAQLMLALYRSGRQADGLVVYRQTRELLIDELGLEPGVELQQLERSILVQDPVLNVVVDGLPEKVEPLRGICPFKGLAPFETGDAGIFFGRERLVDELVARLADAPLLAIVGPSGSGKSSLLRAGVLPALECEALVIRPSTWSAAELAKALEQPKGGDRLVLAVDQLEELFATDVPESERRAFIDVLVDEAWNPDRRALMLLALRADFFGRLGPYVELADLVGQNNVLLGSMSASELRRAIEGPAARAGLVVEPALVDTLVDEVAGEAGGLPLLSTALLDLWHERKNGSLTLAAYEHAGGVRGAVGRHAEAAFRALDADDRGVARRILLRLTAGGDGEAITRRRVTRAELDADDDERVSRVVAALVDRRLLVADDDTVELVHESLLERWPRLRGWLADDAQGRVLHRHLTEAAREWAGAGRDAGELYRGARLAAAVEWADEHASELNRLEREFVDESRDASERETRRQRRANRRLRFVLVCALVLLAVSIVAAVVGLRQWSEAQNEAAVADAQRLGAQALTDPNLDRSLLLAREGVNLDDSTATRSNLLATLLRSPAAIGVARQGSDRLLDEALSPDGRTLAVRGDDGNVVFLDARTLRRIGRPLATGNQVAMFGAVPGPLHALAFSGDGKTLAVGSTDSNSALTELFGAQTHEPLGQYALSPYQSLTADVAFAPNGRFFATGEPVNGIIHPPPAVIVSWNARTADARAESPPIAGGRLAGYTRDGRFLLVASGQHRSMLLGARTLEPVRTFPVGGAAALSPAADAAAFGHADGTVTILELGSGRTKQLAGQSSASIETLSFSRDGTMLAGGAADGGIGLWSLRTGTLRETLHGHTASVRAVVFSPDGRTLYTAGNDGSLIAWDLSGVRRLGQPFRYASHPNHLSFAGSAVSPDGSVFATSPGPNRVTVRRSDTRAPTGPELRGPVGNVNGLAFSPDGRLVAAAGSRRDVLWDTRSGEILGIKPGNEPANAVAGAVAISPDGHTVATGGIGGAVALYDIRTGRQTAYFSSARGSIPEVDFSPDGRLVASVSLNGTTSIWDVASGRRVQALAGPFAAFAVRFSPDGKLLAVGDSSGKAVFWDVAGGKPVGQPVVGHGGGVTSVDFDPDGSRLVTASADGNLRLWDVATRRLIGAPLPGSTSGGSVAFFPDGRHVLGVFQSGAAIVWNVDPAAWAAKACSVARRTLTRTEWTQFLGRRRYREVCR